MKRHFFTIILLFITILAYNQTLYVPTGTSGIGSSTNENVGIGAVTPKAKLSVYLGSGDGTFPSTTSRGDVVQFLECNNNAIEIGNARNLNARRAWILTRHHDVSRYGKYYSTLHLQPDVEDKSAYHGVAIGYPADTHVNTGVHLAVNGKVGIKTLNPNYDLDVNGTIHTQEVKVDMTGWSDFVFHPTYNLRPLQEVNTYIQQNGHLPEIPTATEVKENGISLGEMNAKLLQKIEELTLYVIEQEREIEELKELNEKLTNQNNRIEKLEEIIKELTHL